MTREERDYAYTRFISEYGKKPQIDMCIEEMSELTKALLKYGRAAREDLLEARDNIIDEIADVKIMCEQMEFIFDSKKEVEQRIDFKINRQISRLNNKKRK